MIRLEPKRSDETRRLAHDWSAFLGTDTISGTPTVTSPDVTISGVSVAGNVVSWKTAGGTDGENATITQSIVTAAGDHETETFVLPIADLEVLTLGQVKEYLGAFTSDKDRSLMQMITRARRWVEDHTGTALVRRQFVERLLPLNGLVRLTYKPLVSVDSVDYLDTAGSPQTLTPIAYPPATAIFAASRWPTLAPNEAFEIAYTAGELAQDVDDRLVGAMLALIEGEFSEGYAYPERATDAAERCCLYLRQMVA